MDPPHPRRRLSITLRGDTLPAPTSPSLSGASVPPPLIALLASLIPAHGPSSSDIATTVLHAAQLPMAADRIQHIFAIYDILLDRELCDQILHLAAQPPAEQNLGARDLVHWNDHASAVFSAAAVAAGTARYVALPDKLEESSGEEGKSSGTAASSSKGGDIDASWLRRRLASLVVVEAGGALSASEMALSVVSLLADVGRSDEEIQGDLFDAFGGDFDAVVEVLGKRAELVAAYDQVVRDCTEGMERRDEGEEGRGRKSRRGRRGTGEDDTDTNGVIGPGLGGNMFKERERYFPGVQVERDAVIGAVDHVGLPKGSTREVGKGYEEIFVPPPSGKGAHTEVPLVDVKEAFKDHAELLQAMKGVERLNRLQSTVFPIAFTSDENLLVCAPTGAGKTNVALLTIFREIVEIKRRMKRTLKVVYVAPMKALAAEVTEKFGGRLESLGLKVREFTGDMSLTRLEALETHVLVTTPEKWDVVTRKSGSELGDAVTLFIIDEIHLLHDDRGAVLESIVARTLRLSETAQRQIRLVGLSATLPNYADVGAFMRVDPLKGLFYFDASHRPVPLSQTFIGISEGGQSNSGEARRKREDKMHEMAWKKVKDSLQRGHQAMIFVHSRKRTSIAAKEMLSRAAQDEVEDIFLSDSKSKRAENSDGGDGGNSAAVMPSWASKEVARSKTADIRELCARGVGIHNAGLPRVDRKLVEKLFAEGVIRLLCCTATLAWGVNLPARSVVIMGTEVYDAEKGGFVQLGMLDVMQIFGRAGRPQFDTEGEGTIITMHEHLGKYLNLLTSSLPIESQLGSSASRLADHLNAEVVSGTVSSIGEGVRWLSYTYLSVRMPQNPLVYGINWAEVEADIGLHSRRATLIEQASKALDDARMCRYDPRTGVLAPTDLGRVASHFYVSHETVVLWNEVLGNLSMGPALSESDWEEVYAVVLHAVSCATEFEQMRSRQEEAEELDNLTRQACPIPLKAGSETREGKVAILLQAYISRAPIRMSDLSYVVQSSTRLLRALFEISLRRGLPSMSLASLELARASESRIWPFQHPLWQFTYSTRRISGLLLTPETVSTIENNGSEGSLESLKRMTKDDLSILIRAPKMASTVLRVANAVPTLEIVQARVAFLNRTVLQIDVSLFPGFRWNEAVHGNAESWWMWLEDQEEDRVYHSQRILLTKRQVRTMNSEPSVGTRRVRQRTLDLTFSVPVFDPPSSQYFIRVESEHWHTGGGVTAVLAVSDIVLPKEECEYTRLLDLRPLPLDAALPARERPLFSDMSHLKPLQTQAFHTAYCTSENMLISAPAGSGKWAIAELAVLQALQARPNATVICLEPDRQSLLLREKSWQKLKKIVGGKFQTLDSRFAYTETPPFQDVKILITTPEAWSYFTRTWEDGCIAKWTSLFVFHELHLMRDAKHFYTELVISRLRNLVNKQSSKKSQYPRLVGLCDTIPNAGEFAVWLGVDRQKALFSFAEDVRQVPCESHVIGVAGDRYTSRMHSLNRTLFSMVQRYSPQKPVLVYVSSKRQTLQTAQDLIRLASIDGKKDAFFGSHGNMHANTAKALRELSDSAVRRCVAGGVGLYHSKMSAREREAVESLYRTGHIQIMIATFDVMRGLSVPSHLVIVKGTEAYRRSERRYEDIPISDIIHMIGQAGRPSVDSLCYSVVFVHEPKKTLFKKLLHESLPIESSLYQVITKLLLNEIALRRVRSYEDSVEYLTWTFLFQRLKTNPGYYGQKTLLRTNKQKTIDKETAVGNALKWCSQHVLEALEELLRLGCLYASSGDLRATAVGQLCVAHDLSVFCIKELCERLLKCKGLGEIVTAFSFLEELVNLVDGIEEDTAWTGLAETICDQFCKENLYPSREQAAKHLGIAQCNESLEKRARVACYSAFISGSVKIDDFGIDQKEVYQTVEKFLAAGFEIVAENRKLSLALEFVRISQALYQGLLPTEDFWTRCGHRKDKISVRGREANYVTMGDVRRNEGDFHAFLAKNCDNEAQRGTITRWLARRPRLNVKAQRDPSNWNHIVVNIEIERSSPLSHEGVEALSHLTSRRNGGLVIAVGNSKTDELYKTRRISESGHKYERYLVPVDVDSSAAEGEKLHVWVMSDVDMGVEADTPVL